MNPVRIGLLHPGQMGAAVGAQLVAAGHGVRWLRTGRKPESVRRAADAGLRGVDTMGELLSACNVVLSICPPAAAGDVAAEVASAAPAAGFTGVFVDANAISPNRMARIADLFAGTGVAVLDGAIIGGPPAGSSSARVYLSGPAEAVSLVSGLLAGTRAAPVDLDRRLGTASALKMAFGCFQKASRALAAVSHALADDYGVTPALLAEATALGRNALTDRDHLASVAARAWRWGPEMHEAAAAFAERGLPTDLATAAAAVFGRWNADRDAWDLGVTAALDHLRASATVPIPPPASVATPPPASVPGRPPASVPSPPAVPTAPPAAEPASGDRRPVS
ncbi:MAG TPA: DUF1932 domain-containing protein [Pseudonocardiaceae bacterium]